MARRRLTDEIDCGLFAFVELDGQDAEAEHPAQTAQIVPGAAVRRFAFIITASHGEMVELSGSQNATAHVDENNFKQLDNNF